MVPWLMAVVMTWAVGPAVRSTAPDAAVERLNADVGRAARMYEGDDYGGCYNVMQAVLADRAFSRLNADDSHYALSMQAGCALWSHHFEAAHSVAKRATAMAQATGFDWQMRFHSAVMLDEPDMAESLLRLARDYPDYLKYEPSQAVWSARAKIRAGGGKMGPGGAGRLFDTDEALLANWKPDGEIFFDVSPLAADHIVALVARKRLADAQPLVRRVVDLRRLAGLRADRRFDALRARDPGAFDLRAAAERQLAMLRALAAANPDKLEGVVDVAMALMPLDRNEEALALIDAALARVQAAPDGKPAYSDQADNLNWARDCRSRLLFRLGRTEEALAALRQAAATREFGTPNVSQSLNLGFDLQALGRPQEALAAIEPVGNNVSAFGMGVKLQAHACAVAQLGDLAGARADAAKIAKLNLETPEMQLQALACGGDMDGAAALYIAGLKDPDQRPDLLATAQIGSTPRFRTPGELMDQKIYTPLLARPDVRAAIARVGRVETFDLRSF